MFFGLNNERERIRPAKGLTALCELCSEELVPVCGDINIHHWRHRKITDCDPWNENETDWHRNWKRQFPNDWLEVVIKKNFSIHRADIKTKAGLVVELQNSSISQSDILDRELFYGNMIWLINAKNFIQNFKIRSIVSQELRVLDIKIKIQLNKNSQIEGDLTPLFKNLNKQKGKLKNFEYELKSQERKLAELVKGLESINENLTEICKNYNRPFSFKCQTPYIFNDFTCDHILSLQKISTRLENIDSELSEVIDKNKMINELPDYRIDDNSCFKIVPFNRVSQSSFAKCKVVKKDTINTFFLTIRDLDSESNFIWYSLQENAYMLLINLSNDLNTLLKNKNQLELERCILIKNKRVEFRLLKKSVRKYLLNQIRISKEKIFNLTYGIENQENEIQGIEDDIKAERKNLLEESFVNEKMIRFKGEKDKSVIMKDKKGLYFYEWKYKRPSWNLSKAPLFFDFGGHIFQVLNNNELRKIPINDFVKFVKEWK